MNEDVLLEEVLALAEQDGYEPAYDFLLAQRGAWKDGEHPQIYYFLACLAAGAGRAPAALEWLAEAVEQKEYWYRPEVLDDGDLKPLFGDARFEPFAYKISGALRRGPACGQDAVFVARARCRNVGAGGARQRTNQPIVPVPDRARRATRCAERQCQAVLGGGLHGRFRWEYDGEKLTGDKADAARVLQTVTRAMSGGFGRAFPPAVICRCARCCIPGFPATCWRCNPRGHRCLRRTAQRFAVRWRKKT